MNSIVTRRNFVTQALIATAGAGLGSATWARDHTRPKGWFTTVKLNGRWWFRTPDGTPFWSIGLNHLDPATLRYVENEDLWHDKYGNSMERWLGAVREDLQSWGFNTLGWNQEVVVINEYNGNHSRSFTWEEYQWLGLPYCHMLPFIESHQWENATRLPDLRSRGFADWCDYVARDHCARMRDDANLIGYWFTDCPTWVHHRDRNAWKGALFDADDLKTRAGRRELLDLATTYYRGITEAIRRYDPQHLILGDRYEANAPLPDEVVQAALPYVDVLAFQCFGPATRVQKKLTHWAQLAGKPILLADSANWSPSTQPGWPPSEDRHHWPEGYAAVTQVLQDMPECVGYHLCGAYLRNRVRRFGLRDATGQIDPSTAGITEVNKATARWIDKHSQGSIQGHLHG